MSDSRMVYVKTLQVLTVALFVAFLSTAALAAGPGGGGRGRGAGGPKRGDRGQIRENTPDDIKALLEKKRAGDELTDEEKAKLKEFAAKARERIRRNSPEDIKGLMRRKRAGDELTDEEKSQLKESGRKARRRLRRGAKPEPAPEQPAE